MSLKDKLKSIVKCLDKHLDNKYQNHLLFGTSVKQIQENLLKAAGIQKKEI